MRIYERFDGKWVLVAGALANQEYPYDTQAEAMTAMSKLATATAIVQAVQSLASAADGASDLEAEYFDVGAPQDEDVTALGLTAADIAACVTLLQQVHKLMTNQATTPAAYRTTLNKVRRVGAG